jgi:hypothetical protein
LAAKNTGCRTCRKGIVKLNLQGFNIILYCYYHGSLYFLSKRKQQGLSSLENILRNFEKSIHMNTSLVLVTRILELKMFNRTRVLGSCLWYHVSAVSITFGWGLNKDGVLFSEYEIKELVWLH